MTFSLLVLFLCFKVLQTEASTWTAKVPSSVKGLIGSCVVIPCTFDYANPGKTLTGFTGMWNNEANEHIYHSVKSKVLQRYQTRTELLGDISQKNCSLMIDPLQENDRGPFYFRIEIDGLDKFTYRDSPVSIEMIREPDPVIFSGKPEVQEGETVSASCSVSFSCPASPPVFNWSHSGEKHFQQTEHTAGQWKATSTLTFHPTRADHEKILQCTVRYKGGKLQNASKVLRVKYAPEIKTGSSCSSEADKVKCVCIAESRPPSMVHFVLSDRVLPKAKVEKHGPVTIGTLQAEFGSSEFVHCLAKNTQGTANLTLYFPVNSKMQNMYIYLAIGTGVTLVIVLIAVGVKKCRGRPKDVARTHLSTMKVEKDVEPPQYAAAKRKVNNYDDVDSQEVYANDPVYGNMETDLDDAIYANV
ncbi:myelin-associated glycoprotein-like isoform X2 [Notolabrus celidotus]|uniref:myelin-associated glycoprotein-like isoform X2 n=1 Tax=Notolabrus celidotus TaxID=1203425 RepID=UPI0014900DFF|nr:myelin-associated glycoprotein-like isoform X2 [Notolabrus celidotus]